MTIVSLTTLITVQQGTRFLHSEFIVRLFMYGLELKFYTLSLKERKKKENRKRNASLKYVTLVGWIILLFFESLELILYYETDMNDDSRATAIILITQKQSACVLENRVIIIRFDSFVNSSIAACVHIFFKICSYAWRIKDWIKISYFYEGKWNIGV